MKSSSFCFFTSLLLSGCVSFNGMDPNSGPERTLVDVDGSTFLGSVVWDAGSASEAILPGGFLGGYMFSVPVGASLGVHDVAIERGSSRTGTLPFTVTAPVPFTAPRVDRISIVYADFAAGDVNTWLYVQGANGDVGAEVLIGGVAQPTIAHKALRNDLFGIPPDDLEFPIYHWTSYVVPYTGPAGSTITVSMRNRDGQLSADRSYRLPDNASSLDSDGDDLPDVWETSGYDADGDGVIDIDLPALGANPYRPDVFVEIDIMNGLDNPPTAATWTGSEAVFENAPIINPIGDNGINIHIDSSGTVPFWNAIDFNIAQNIPLGREDFYTLKGANFDNAIRGRIYHYGIWANARPNGSSGVSDVDFASGNGGDDFIVSFDDFPASTQTEKSRIETFVHEFGHNLSLRHGGSDHATRVPTHNSVMSYSWQLRTSNCCGNSDASRQANPVYGPLYYLTTGLDETAGAVPVGFSNLTDYSDGMGRNLQENCLDETVGLWGGRAVDWNGDGDTTDVCAARVLNSDGDTNDTVTDYASWANITFVGPRTNGQFGS
ncbi:MAG: hypothetical protein ABW092_09265 [Candidatus Thiodiazotropha sp.]